MLFEKKYDLKSPIKWAGGKSFLTENIKEYILKGNDKKRFVELFGGSMALTLQFQPKNALINDISEPLITMWKTIKKYPDELCVLLKELDKEEKNNKKEFGKIRENFNKMKEKISDEKDNMVKLSGYFIYLNKRGYNGLYRENSSGVYNVPFRHYKNGNIYHEEQIRELSKYFNECSIEFICGEFDEVKLLRDDFVYMDPPYYPSETSSFTLYHKTGFPKEKHNKILELCDELDKKKSKFLQSNAPCSEIKELYKKYNYKPFFIQRNMRNAKKKEEGDEQKNNKDNEVFIMNF